MGGNTVTMQHLKVVKVDLENNVLLIKGNVPGANKSYVTIKNSVKANTKKSLSKQHN
jgi:large subunit ribosomal protein L3